MAARVKVLPAWSIEARTAMETLRTRLVDTQVAINDLLQGRGAALLSRGYLLRAAMFEVVGELWRSHDHIRFRFVDPCCAFNAEDDALFVLVGRVARLCISSPRIRKSYRSEFVVAVSNIDDAVALLDAVIAQKRDRFY